MLERLAMRSRWLQQILLSTHRRALRKLLPYISRARCITIVGGGMYPRTALLLRELLPDARIRIIDASRENLDAAEAFLSGGIEYEHGVFDSRRWIDADLLIIPLSFHGDRQAIYRDPPARAILVHDWIWSPHGASAVVSLFLLKRMNLIIG
jgi:hypothetical protein